jgi:hypothetical protein
VRAAALVLVLAGCAAASDPDAPDPAPEPALACHIQPVTISTHDQLTPATLRDIRRVNRDLRARCAD